MPIIPVDRATEKATGRAVQALVDLGRICSSNSMVTSLLCLTLRVTPIEADMLKAGLGALLRTIKG